MNVSQRIVCEIADREGVHPTDLEPPLDGVIDTVILEALPTDLESRQTDPCPEVEFEYYGYAVTIDGAGTVTISDQSSTGDELTGETSESSLEKLSAEMVHRERALRNIVHIIAAGERPFAERLSGLLETVRRVLALESATLSYVDSDSYVFEAVDVTDDIEIQAGEIVPLADTACEQVIETERALVLRDVEAEAPEVADSAFGVSSYIGVPVFVNGDVYGTFCFYDSDPRIAEFSDWERALVELRSHWVSSELEKRQRERALHAATTERPSAET